MTGNIGSSPGGSTRIIDSTGQSIQLRDALIGLLLTAALVAVPLGVLLALRELGVGDNRLLALFPVAVGLSIALATAALVLYMKRRGIALGFHPLRGDGRHLMWEVPCIMLLASIGAGFFGSLLGLDNETSNPPLEDGLGILLALAT